MLQELAAQTGAAVLGDRLDALLPRRSGSASPCGSSGPRPEDLDARARLPLEGDDVADGEPATAEPQA